MLFRVVLADLPCTVGGYCVTNADGEKICVLNSKHSRERNLKTLMHELRHGSDFGKDIDVNQLEADRHK
jgi:Zn-dependent peptidase ImmA (M78 family)